MEIEAEGISRYSVRTIKKRLCDICQMWYICIMSPNHKPLAWLTEFIKTPPLSKEARIEAGYYLRLLQAGENIGMPHSRPMPSIGKRCHELRIRDENLNWRIFYRIDDDAIVIAHWTAKKSQATSKKDLELCKVRFKEYDLVSE